MSRDGTIDMNGWGPSDAELEQEALEGIEEFGENFLEEDVPVRPVIVHEHVRFVRDD